jgi:hypothetical protein
LLHVLRACSSIQVLQIFYPLLLQRDHFYMAKIHAALENFAVNSASQDNFRKCWNEGQDEELDFALRICIVDHVCVPMLETMSRPVAQATIREHISAWQANIAASTGSRASSSGMATVVLHRAALAFSLTQAAYRSIGKTSPINQLFDYGGGYNKQELIHLCKAATHALKEGAPQDVDAGEAYDEARTHYHMRAYNAVTEALVRTQLNAKIFDIIFDESRFGGKLWQSLVDTQEIMEPFYAETSFLVQNRRIGDLRKERQASNPAPVLGAARFLSTQYIAGSSLAHDVGYSQPVQMTQDNTQYGLESQTQGSGTQMMSPSKSSAQDSGISAVDTEENVEMDVMNKNVCMDLVTRAIRTRMEIRDAAAVRKPSPR